MKNSRKIKIILLVTAGTFFLAIGIIGVFIPVLPTTPFLLIAAAIYAKSSRRFYNWLLNNKVFGKYIRNYREGKGIPVKVKVFIIAFLWITIGISAFFVSDILWLIIVLGIVAIGVTIHIARIRPKDKNKINTSN